MDRFLRDIREAEEVEYVHRKRIFSDFDERFPRYFEETHTEFVHVLECLKPAGKQALSQLEKELRSFVESHYENIDKAAFFALPSVRTTTSVLKTYFAEFAQLPIHRDDYQKRLLATLKVTLKARDVIPARPNALFPDSEIQGDAEKLFTAKTGQELTFVDNVLLDEGCYSGFLTKQNRRTGEGIFRTKFGERFSGWWRDDQPHGYGTQTYSDGSSYTGGWAAGKRHGCGRFQFSNGVSYLGQWDADHCLARFNLLSYSYKGWFASSYVAFAVLLYVLVGILNRPPVLGGMQFHRHSDGFYLGDLSWNQARHGHGIFIWTGGDFYSGHWAKDQMHGEGTMLTVAGDLYSGQFLENKFQSGKIMHKLANGDQLITDRIAGQLNSEAILISPAGDLQRGSWNSTHMQGLRLTANSTLFYGTFRDNVPISGKMIVTNSDDSTYLGEFADGAMDGFGCLVEGDRIFCGEWDHSLKKGTGFEYVGRDSLRLGMFEGGTLLQGKRVAMTGNIFYGEVLKDVESGYGVSVDRNGTVYFGNWDKGLKSGPGTEISPNGSFSIGQFRHNSLYQGKSLRVNKFSELAYYGEIAEFTVSGRGVAVREDGSVYAGQWVGGIMAGMGVEVKGNLDFSVGIFAENRVVEGVVYVSKLGGEIYFGQSKESRYSGQGIYIWNIAPSSTNVSAYLGDWVSGKMHGSGILLDFGKIVKSGVFHNGKFQSGLLFSGSDVNEIYFGEFNNSVKAGKGVSVLNNSTVSVGYWSADTQEGLGFQISINGDYLSGHFQNDVLIQGMALMNLSSGDIYFGERLKGRHNGHGILVSKDRTGGGAITAYVGQWVNGKMHGSGIQMRLGSIIQRGQFSVGKFMAGSTFRVSENAGIYYGAMNNSLRHGKGVFVFNNDTVYSGLWENDYQEGSGLMVSALGDYCSGTFKRNVLTEGLALMNLPKGEIYFGKRVQGKYQGYGIYIWTDKPSTSSIYMGEWLNNKMHGAGMLLGLQLAVKRGTFQQGKFSTGMVFTSIESVGVFYGEMANFEKQGYGTFIYANKTGYSGLWEKDQWSGVGVLVQPNGDFFTGEFEEGRLANGTKLHTLQNEDVYFGEVLDGKFHGNGTYIWRDGPSRHVQTYTGGWQHGRADGSGVLLRLTSNLTKEDLSRSESTTALLYYENNEIVFGSVEHSLRHGGGAYLWKQGVLSVGDSGSQEAKIPQTASNVTADDGLKAADHGHLSVSNKDETVNKDVGRAAEGPTVPGTMKEAETIPAKETTAKKEKETVVERQREDTHEEPRTVFQAKEAETQKADEAVFLSRGNSHSPALSTPTELSKSAAYVCIGLLAIIA